MLDWTTAKAAGVVCDLAEIVRHHPFSTLRSFHRDLKPANILVVALPDSRFRYRSTDFGIGGLAAYRELDRNRSGLTQGHPFVTAARGAFSPLYASPQQLAGADPDSRDDVFALGVIWYQILTGDLLNGRPGGSQWKKSLEDRGMPTVMVALLESCFEERPAHRPNDAAALADSIARFMGSNDSPKVAAASSDRTSSGLGPAPPTIRPEQFALPPLQIAEVVQNSQQIDWAEVDLPPIPKENLELEAKLVALQETVVSLKEGSHSQLQLIYSQITELKDRHKQLVDRLMTDDSGLSHDEKSSLIEIIEKTPDNTVMRLHTKYPSVPQRTFLRFIHQARQADDLRRTYNPVATSATCGYKIETVAIEKQIHQTDEALVTATTRRSPCRARYLVQNHSRAGGVPDQGALVEWIPLLEARRYRWSEQHTLDEAEQFFQEWSCCLDDPWTYIEKYPEGELVSRCSVIPSRSLRRQWDEEKKDPTLARAISQLFVLGSNHAYLGFFLVLLLTLFSFIKLL